MKRHDYWQLTVHFWPAATEAGVQPVKANGFEEGPQFYRPDTIDFDHPPSRDEFLAVVQTIPWMSVWQDTLLPVVANNPWPMIDFAHKAAHIDLKNEQGQIVGQLEVRRQERWANAGYCAPFITTDMIRSAARLHNGKMAAAIEHVELHRHRLMERLAMQPGSSQATTDTEIRKLLVVGGFLKKV
ncbi:MAG: hypothetical protein GXX96_35825 [Planctomycetaceae bacterium]|nr:hypothetical protein [Planctomycetaceae bacterium]